MIDSSQLHAAADRHEHEDVQRIGAEIQRQLVRLVELLVVVLGDGGVDLHRHAVLRRALKPAIDESNAPSSAELIVGRRRPGRRS